MDSLRRRRETNIGAIIRAVDIIGDRRLAYSASTQITLHPRPVDKVLGEARTWGLLRGRRETIIGTIIREDLLTESRSPVEPAVHSFANASLIFDHVLHDRAIFESYRAATAGREVFSVGVTCPIDVLEARGRSRGDRVLGRARGLADIVHGFCGYDVMVDTGMPSSPCFKMNVF